MKMEWKFLMLGIVLLLVAAAAPMRAQAPAQTPDKHVVSLDELNKDAAQPAETRQASRQGDRAVKRCRSGGGRRAFAGRPEGLCGQRALVAIAYRGYFDRDIDHRASRRVWVKQ